MTSKLLWMGGCIGSGFESIRDPRVHLGCLKRILRAHPVTVDWFDNDDLGGKSWNHKWFQ